MLPTAEELKAFEAEIAASFAGKMIRGPVHLSGGNEEQLLEIFQDVRPEDWVLSTWRNHYHALLKGVPRDVLLRHIQMGPSMNLNFPKYRFLTSAIVAGTLPLACGLAYGLWARQEPAHVWCFVGDMAASLGAFQDAVRFATGHGLPITFVVEDNGYSTDTPTSEAWGRSTYKPDIIRYAYQRTYPHMGIGKWVQF